MSHHAKVEFHYIEEFKGFVFMYGLSENLLILMDVLLYIFFVYEVNSIGQNTNYN